MDQVILDHSDSHFEGLISLTGSYPNFVKEGNKLLSNKSVYVGTSRESETVVNNKKVGWFVRYYGNGVKMSEGRYVNNQKDGVWKHYNRINGKILNETTHRNGEKIDRGGILNFQVVEI